MEEAQKQFEMNLENFKRDAIAKNLNTIQRIKESSEKEISLIEKENENILKAKCIPNNNGEKWYVGSCGTN